MKIVLIRGDGIGVDVVDVMFVVVEVVLKKIGQLLLQYDEIEFGVGYYQKIGCDIELDGEECVGVVDVIFLGVIGLLLVWYVDGMEILFYLRLWDWFGFYVGVCLVKVYINVL